MHSNQQTPDPIQTHIKNFFTKLIEQTRTVLKIVRAKTIIKEPYYVKLAILLLRIKYEEIFENSIKPGKTLTVIMKQRFIKYTFMIRINLKFVTKKHT